MLNLHSKRTILLLFLLLAGKLSAQQLNINPTILSYNARKGETSVQTMVVTNYSSKKQTYKLTLGDWERDSVGSHRYYPANTHKRSCASWIKLDNPFIELDPNQSKAIRIILECPDTDVAVQEAKWAMLFIEGITEQKEAPQLKDKFTTQIRESYQVGVHIYQTPPEINNIAAKALSLTRVPNTPSTYEFTMANTGNVMLNCKLRTELTNIANGKTIIPETVEFPVFPEGRRIVTVKLPADVPKGKYSLVALLDYHDDAPIEGIETTVEIN